MRIETHYFADDDTEFDTEAECREYEELFRAQIESVVFFDENLTVLESLEDVESYAAFMYIKDGEKANALFPRLEEYISFCKPDWEVHTGDAIAWDENGDLIDLQNQLMELTQQLELLVKRGEEA